MKRKIKIKDICNSSIDMLEPVVSKGTSQKNNEIDSKEILDNTSISLLNDDLRKVVDDSLDGVVSLGLTKSKTENEIATILEKFRTGLNNLFSKESNWTFLKPLLLTLETCVKCQTCSNSCPIYESSGFLEIYRPTFRAEILRRLYSTYIKNSHPIIKKIRERGIEINFALVFRLAELSYRCSLCRRCSQSCPLGLDNSVITREIRKMFSQELGIAPKDLHERGTIQHLAKGSTTGMTPEIVRDNVEFVEKDLEERIGYRVETKWDDSGADVLLFQNAGEFLSWPENPLSLSILMDLAGIKWTLSSDLVGYDGVNYGLFYDDVQLAKILQKHFSIAKKLGVKRIVVGECGHSTKVFKIISDRLVCPEIPVEDAMTFIERIVFSGKIKFDPERNFFPVTLHDPCNLVRNVGILEPQRRILRCLAPKFREMTPNGFWNYCCGGGSGFAVMSSYNFNEWKMKVSGKKKISQIIDAFKNEIEDTNIPKIVCAPCSNCKGQIRDLLNFYSLKERFSLHFCGLSELVVNCIPELKEPIIDFSIL
ncbi:MAG: (Fe-S)-binding protein [Ignavibacteria bacterium]|nr:(Fe-S)-binding protein [Ignavibacteria bacterium]